MRCTQDAISAGNVPGKPSYATVCGKPNGKKVNVRTLFTPGGNGINVVVLVDSIRASTRLQDYSPFNLAQLTDWMLCLRMVKLHGVPVTAFSEDGLSAIATKLVMIELRADVELKDNIIVAMPKITRKGHYTCNVRVEYEWKPPRCSSCKVFGHIQEECPKNTGAREKKTVKKPSQTSRGVPVGPKIGFKSYKEYRPVTKKPNASSSGNMKKCVEPIIEVSNSNTFDVLNSVDNDVEFGTNGGTTNLVNSEAISSGSSFMKIDNNGEFASNTPIVPTGIVESDSEVEVVFDETANLRISTSGKDGSDKGYGTNSLLEQWRDSYPDNDDYEPYDDDMYENHDLFEHMQSICDDIDITVHGRKKK
ncbi:nucleotide-diphospho-sugar transferase [Tanacetum coccineum]